ncbi:MFS transporter [Deinococcus sp. JMULE3]|uniref:MFS transporter n=1 Tax=Deinococcus sp. JMULE3 TaxID=2518341 RepID=UPI00157675EB|nr:MFS transporter [Deinococcus sp. JMULE3]NTY00516.1 MFS transporter [Deinococcus sp. JMULE3]
MTAVLPDVPTDLTPDTTAAQRWRYAVMNFGLTIPAQTTSFLLLYYVDHLKLNPGWAATAMTIFALYNAANNPLIGFLSDRTRTRWGRRIPYVRFGALPALILFGLLFSAPFNGTDQPVALMTYFVVMFVLWEGASTAVGTGYLALLPEMFRTFQERTAVAWRMNAVQIVALLVGLALPPLLAGMLGWTVMAWVFAAVSAVAIYAGVGSLFERPNSQERELGFFTALRATFTHRAFLILVTALTMRFFATGTLAAGMGFYVRYSLGIEGGAATTILLAGAFVTAGLALYPWRTFIAPRLGPRGTLMLAFGLTAVSLIPLALVNSLAGAAVTTVLFGAALAGLILMGDVVMADVIDDDELRSGQRRAGMYFGMAGFITTLSSALTAQTFGAVTRASGYDPKLSVQPDTVAEGFRFFMTVPPITGALLALAILSFYPLHGARLNAVRDALARKRAVSAEL